MRNNDLYIFCESYVQLENVLFLSEKNRDKNIILIVIANRDVCKILTHINSSFFNDEMEIKFIENYIHQSNKKFSFRELIDEKIYLNRTFKKLFIETKESTVYFSNRYFASYTYFFINKLNKLNKVIYFPPKNYEEEIPKAVFFNSITDFLKMLKTKIIFGSSIKYIKTSVHVTPYIGDDFLKKIDKVIDKKERQKIVNKDYLKEFNPLKESKFNVVYIDQFFIKDNKKGSDDLRQKEMEKIFKIVNKYFSSENVALKFHPSGHDSFISNSQFGTRIENYIPGEFLINDRVKIYIGFCSTVLNNIEYGVVISLLDMVSFIEEDKKDKWKRLFIKRSTSNAIFPKSLYEFEKLIQESVHEEKA